MLIRYGLRLAVKGSSDRCRNRHHLTSQRAIRKDNPAKEPPTVGKPVIIDPPDETKPAVRYPDRKKPA